MIDDLNIKVGINIHKAMAGLKKLSSEIDKTSAKASSKLKQEAVGLKQLIGSVKKDEKKLETTSNKLSKALDKDKQALVTIKTEIQKLTKSVGKNDYASKNQVKTLTNLANQYRNTSKRITTNNTTLKHNSTALKKVSADVSMLSASQARLRNQINATTMAEKLQSKTMVASARKRAGFGSAAAAISRAGVRPGGLISAGAALGAGGMVGGAASLIGMGAVLGGGAALFKAAQTGMDLEAIIADIMTRPGEGIDKSKLKSSIKRLNSQSAFNLGDVGEAYKTARRSGGYGLTDLEGIVENALLFGQAEDLSAALSTDMLINATGMFNRKVDSKNTNEVANLISATASLSTSNARDVYNALKSSANEVMGIGGASELQTLAGIALMSSKGFKGSANATFRTAMAKDKGTKKIRKTADALGDRTGEIIDLTTAEGSPLAIYGTLQNLARIKGKFANDEVAQNLIAKLMHDAFGARGEGKTGGLLDEMIKDPKILEKKMKEIKFAADNNIVRQLSDAKLGTTAGIMKLLFSELSNTLDSIFVPILKPVMDFIGTTLKADLVNLAVFLDNNKGFTDSFSHLLINLFETIRAIGGFVGNLLVILTPALENISELLTILSPVFSILNGVLKAISGVLGFVGLLGRLVGQLVGWATGGLIAWIKWLGWNILHPFASKPEEESAARQRDSDIAAYTKKGSELGGAVGEFVAPAAAGFLLSGGLGALTTAADIGALASGKAASGVFYTAARGIGSSPIASSIVGGALGGTTYDTLLDQHYKNKAAMSNNTNNITFNIEGVTDPVAVGNEVNKILSLHNFSSGSTMSTNMEAPLY